ncbi:hypothetical protein J437_LFUL002031, partial [Ladona fulva]
MMDTLARWKWTLCSKCLRDRRNFLELDLVITPKKCLVAKKFMALLDLTVKNSSLASASKHHYLGSKIIEITALLATGTFIDSHFFILQVMNDLLLRIGVYCEQFPDACDIFHVRR